jgi:hypothetical protein
LPWRQWAGAYFRVHHFVMENWLSVSPAGGQTQNENHRNRGVIDMRYENPMYMAEDAARRI